MEKFKKILFVADGSRGERGALARAAEIAQANRARLVLIDVLDLAAEEAVDPSLRETLQDMNSALFERRRGELEALGAGLSARYPNLRVGVELKAGRPALEIVRSVLQNRYDLVVKAPESVHGAVLRLFGSTDLKLMRKCPCAVWLVKSGRRRRLRRILAAVDMNPGEPETNELARRIMATATWLARRDKCELHVVHAWRLPGESQIRGRQVVTAKVDRLLEDLEAAHRRDLEALLKEYPYARRRAHMLKGRAGEVIAALAAELDVDLVVLGTVGRSGIPGFFIGNTAEKILNAVDCSVLTLKPAGFETPISV